MQILEVAIGMFFGYLVLSLVVTAANEMSAAWFRRRAWMLHKGIVNLLDDEKLAARLYEHPMIRSLSSPPGLLARVPMLSRLVGRGPSYVRSRTFAIALLDVVRADPGTHAEGSDVQRMLALLREEAKNDPEKFRANVETWFNESMERVTGWYKRRTHVLLLLWASVVTVSTNADTLVIAKALWSNPALRQTLVERAERYAAEEAPPGTPPPVVVVTDGAPPPPELPPDQQADVDFVEASARYDAALADLAELQLPIGWEAPATAVDADPSLRLMTDQATDDWPGAIWEPGALARWMLAFDRHLVGWLITILAVSLGAPFWFDALNRLISIRGGSGSARAEQKPRKAPEQPEPRDEYV